MNLMGDIEYIDTEGIKQTINVDNLKEFFSDKIIARNGAIFDATEHGILPKVLFEWFLKRQEHSSLAATYGNKATESTTEDENEKYNRLYGLNNNIQYALKILINSVYGLLGTEYSRWFDVDCAEAVTLNGQFVIHNGKDIVNDFFQTKKYLEIPEFIEVAKEYGTFNPDANMHHDYIIAIDTDSLFINFGEFFKRGFVFEKEDVSEDEQIEFILKLSKIIEQYLNNEINNRFNEKLNIVLHHEHSINFKQEIVGTTGIFTTKKRYGIKIKNNKGVPCDKLEIKGLDIVRSDSPQYIREKFKIFLNKVLSNEPDDELLRYIDEIKDAFKTLDIVDQAFPKGVQNIEKYVLPGNKWRKGTPIQVKSAINYNAYLQIKGLTHLPRIKSGDKIKFFYMKYNPYMFDTFGFLQWRPEFDELKKFIDINLTVSKLVDTKLEPILNILNLNMNPFGGRLSLL